MSSSIVETGSSSSSGVLCPQGQLLRSLWEGKTLSDLQLRSKTDGSLVSVHRCVLAVASNVFSAMLRGKFQEASKCVIELNFDGVVVRNVAEYIYTDNIEVIAADNKLPSKVQVQSVLALAEAADFLELPKLSDRIKKYCLEAIKENPPLAGLFWSACSELLTTKRDSVHSVIQDHCVAVVRSNPHCLLKEGSNSVAALSESQIEHVLKDRGSLVDEITRFRFLKTWTEHCSVSTEADVVVSEPIRLGRKRKATELSQIIQIDRIRPKDLKAHVEPSGLVPAEKILQAFRTHALRSDEGAKETGSIIDLGSDTVGVFATSGTTLFDPQEAGIHGMNWVEPVLCPPLVSGVHKWSFRLLKPKTSARELTSTFTAYFGLASAFHDFGRCGDGSINGLGATNDTWSYASDGDAWWSNKNVKKGALPTMPNFGSTATFRLDLTGPGTLSISVDEGEESMLFDDLIAQLGATPQALTGARPAGFVPAVEAHPEALVFEFLGFASSSHAAGN